MPKKMRHQQGARDKKKGCGKRTSLGEEPILLTTTCLCPFCKTNTGSNSAALCSSGFSCKKKTPKEEAPLPLLCLFRGGAQRTRMFGLLSSLGPGTCCAMGSGLTDKKSKSTVLLFLLAKSQFARFHR